MSKQRSTVLPSRMEDITGKKFGRWTVLQYADKRGGTPYWMCRCECGTVREVTRVSLGRWSNSCGCLKNERAAELKTRHGRYETGEYNSWHSMLQRCTNPNNPSYHRYGGRGITVCPEWRQSFQAFYEDMGCRPPDHTLERVDNAGDYNKDNCVWATKKEQQRNKRTNRLLTFQGETLCLVEWAQRIQLDEGTIRARLRLGWSVELALTAPRGFRPKR